ncbi:MAG: UDP-N-acetylmuramoyl-L-alanyl-D-glutamate--2,6-diaminopimelate ligase, partial [Cyclobacteriaceae bacterium]|nr:UDP-N-acetylmuramoyl-L-alanyl-D-glutamate--2,6-diaminopimelate ligase [Cyclobacteriaceae bacterium]
RPLMAEIAARFSDKIILTSDNPRFEDPVEIIREMEKGLSPVEQRKSISITDREEAIKAACMMANPFDIILVAGKGHETYQEIKGERFPFDDKEILGRFLTTLTN